MKKQYQKPQVTRVNLKIEQTVLAGCKFNGSTQDARDYTVNCQTNEFIPQDCMLPGS